MTCVIFVTDSERLERFLSHPRVEARHTSRTHDPSLQASEDSRPRTGCAACAPVPNWDPPVLLVLVFLLDPGASTDRRF